jgi:hypothetical protein
MVGLHGGQGTGFGHQQTAFLRAADSTPTGSLCTQRKHGGRRERKIG